MFVFVCFCWSIRMRFRVLQTLNSSWNSYKPFFSSSHAYESFLQQTLAFDLSGYFFFFYTLDCRMVFCQREWKRESSALSQFAPFLWLLRGLYRGPCVWGEIWKCEEVTGSMLKNAASLDVLLKQLFYYSLSHVAVLSLYWPSGLLLFLAAYLKAESLQSQGVWLGCVCVWHLLNACCSTVKHWRGVKASWLQVWNSTHGCWYAFSHRCESVTNERVHTHFFATPKVDFHMAFSHPS